MFQESFPLHRTHPCQHCSAPRGNEIAQYVLSCSHLALYRCGQILTKAATAFLAGDDKGSIEQSAFARQELDRSRYLEERWREGVRGAPISVDEVNRSLKNYLMHQDWGQHPLVQQFCGKGMIKKMLRVMDRPPAESNHCQAPEEQSGDPTKREREQSNPWQSEGEQVRRFVQDVIDEYKFRHDRVQSFDALNLTDPQLAHGLMCLEDRGRLSPPPSLD
jgi:hypothetical protein